jgi:hypothetical protein
MEETVATTKTIVAGDVRSAIIFAPFCEKFGTAMTGVVPQQSTHQCQTMVRHAQMPARTVTVVHR